MASSYLTLTSPVAPSADSLVEIRKQLGRLFKRLFVETDGVSVASLNSNRVGATAADVRTGTQVIATVPTIAPTTVAGTNGILQTILTWVKSTDASIVVQKIVVINAALAVLKTVYVAPADQSATITLTAVAQTATVTAINSAGNVVSAASAAFTPSAS